MWSEPSKEKQGYDSTRIQGIGKVTSVGYQGNGELHIDKKEIGGDIVFAASLKLINCIFFFHLILAFLNFSDEDRC